MYSEIWRHILMDITQKNVHIEYRPRPLCEDIAQFV
jgi:hypothetical protein